MDFFLSVMDFFPVCHGLHRAVGLVSFQGRSQDFTLGHRSWASKARECAEGVGIGEGVWTHFWHIWGSQNTKTAVPRPNKAIFFVKKSTQSTIGGHGLPVPSGYAPVIFCVVQTSQKLSNFCIRPCDDANGIMTLQTGDQWWRLAIGNEFVNSVPKSQCPGFEFEPQQSSSSSYICINRAGFNWWEAWGPVYLGGTGRLQQLYD